MARFGWKPYISAAMRRRRTARDIARFAGKGKPLSPVLVDGRAIATTFWGKAWCDNLERYSDFANRLPRGRSYVRSGAVVDLHITPGAVSARVSGSRLYRVKVNVMPVPKPHWDAICADCAGEIDSLVELLQGRLSSAVMTRLCQETTGLFPSPAEINFTCSCPDWAFMCKHVAAVLYGIGSRLDAQPELLFVLRKVDQQDLIARGGSDLSRARPRPAAAKVLESEDLSVLFGIEISQIVPSKTPAVAGPESRTRRSRASAPLVRESRGARRGSPKR
jgi:uncharacterized Zn finger protein